MAQPDQRAWTKPEMVHWYSPRQLAETGAYALLSTLLGSMIDTRRFLPFEASEEESIIDYSDRNDVWFDYAADTGDGWDVTYTLAYLFMSPEIQLESGETLPRGAFLILGGDEVYPRASKEAYAKRLVWPFNQAARNLGQMAVDGRTPRPDHRREIYCVPGNHDWYDGLAAFVRRFCSGRPVGSFQTRQQRSYFVLKLPHRWQIWAADIQLGHDIDVGQLNFFRRHAKSLEPGTRVVLCLAEPDWVYGERAGESFHFNIERLERMAEARGAKVSLELAGDIHNYQRYEGTREPGGEYKPYHQTKIVSGGSGAFLHPTHTFSLGKKISGGFVCENRYPEARTSWFLSLGDLLFAFKNWEMSALLGLTYLFMFWSVPVKKIGQSFAIENPGSTLLMLLLFATLAKFSDFRRPGYNLLWGLAHAGAHVAAAFFVWLLIPALFPETWLYIPRLAVFLVGGVVGGTLFGLYLFVSLSAFRIHENEAFSALRIAHHKHLLRFHLTAEGLKLYVIAAEKMAGEDGHHPVATRLVEMQSIS